MLDSIMVYGLLPQVIIGEQLSAIAFVQDYVQLHFDGPRLTIFYHAVFRLGDQTFPGGKPGFRDALCNNIAKKVTEARVAYGDNISISERRKLLRWRSSQF